MHHFESLPQRLKIHHYYRLLDASQEVRFSQLLDEIMQYAMAIDGIGVAGYETPLQKHARVRTVRRAERRLPGKKS